MESRKVKGLLVRVFCGWVLRCAWYSGMVCAPVQWNPRVAAALGAAQGAQLRFAVLCMAVYICKYTGLGNISAIRYKAEVGGNTTGKYLLQR